MIIDTLVKVKKKKKKQSNDCFAVALKPFSRLIRKPIANLILSVGFLPFGLIIDNFQ